MGLLLATLQAFAIMMAISFGLLLITMAVTMFWVRRTVTNKIYAYFVEPNNQINRELIPLNGSEKVESKDGGSYIVVADKAKWSKWPPGLPSWAQETVPTLFYERNKPEPFDPRQRNPVLSAKSLQYITDEGMLRATWKDAHESANEGKIAGAQWTTWLAIGNVVLVVVLGVIVWLTYSNISQSSAQVQELLNIVKGLE